MPWRRVDRRQNHMACIFEKGDVKDMMSCHDKQDHRYKDSFYELPCILARFRALKGWVAWRNSITWILHGYLVQPTDLPVLYTNTPPLARPTSSQKVLKAAVASSDAPTIVPSRSLTSRTGWISVLERCWGGDLPAAGGIA